MTGQEDMLRAFWEFQSFDHQRRVYTPSQGVGECRERLCVGRTRSEHTIVHERLCAGNVIRMIARYSDP